MNIVLKPFLSYVISSPNHTIANYGFNNKNLEKSSTPKCIPFVLGSYDNYFLIFSLRSS